MNVPEHPLVLRDPQPGDILAPEARGLGLGSRLSDAAIDFARAKGYRKMVLWTNSGLTAARAIYARRGFVLKRSEPYRGFGHDLVGETWELKLSTQAPAQIMTF